MKFATVRIGTPAAKTGHLLQLMLHNFRRIHAAKSSHRRRAAVAFQSISKLIQ
jgi:hypothetical protein